MRGINEKRRSLRGKWLVTSSHQNEGPPISLALITAYTHPTVSPHVGSVSPSHMKLPMKAQIADMNNVTGTKNEVAIITGRTKMRKR
jgi:hypothetical protein